MDDAKIAGAADALLDKLPKVDLPGVTADLSGLYSSTSLTSVSPAVTYDIGIHATPVKSAGDEWVEKLDGWKLSTLDTMIAAWSAEQRPRDFLRYLMDEASRVIPNGYSYTPYNLAQEFFELITNSSMPMPIANPMNGMASQVDVANLSTRVTALEQQIVDLKEEINRKDNQWGQF